MAAGPHIDICRRNKAQDITKKAHSRPFGERNMSRMQDVGGRGAKLNDLPGQIVLVLQGGGALGSYQAGVYQALHESGIEPDSIIGTSIGAINATLIAANEAQARP